MELPQMDAVVRPFLASLPVLALDPKLLLPFTKHHLRFFRANYRNIKEMEEIRKEMSDEVLRNAPEMDVEILFCP